MRCLGQDIAKGPGLRDADRLRFPAVLNFWPVLCRTPLDDHPAGCPTRCDVQAIRLEGAAGALLGAPRADAEAHNLHRPWCAHASVHSPHMDARCHAHLTRRLANTVWRITQCSHTAVSCDATCIDKQVHEQQDTTDLGHSIVS